MIRRPHVCDDRCVCPTHDTPLLYWPAGDEHACQDRDCEHAHGMGSQSGPPWTHSFQHPAPEIVMVETEDGTLAMVEQYPLLPTHTITRAPRFTGVLDYLEDRCSGT